MIKEKKYRVTAELPDGKQIIICQHVAKEIAERVVNLIEFNSQFREFRIEEETDDKCSST